MSRFKRWQWKIVPFESCAKDCRHAGCVALHSQATWGRGYWEQNMNQECYTGDQLTAVFLIGIPGTVLFCIGIPLATFFVLNHHRGQLDKPRVAACLGFLYHIFKCGAPLLHL
jgi:hypothetical protein